ncbi:MAG: carboxypeptidase regulatory-like domain-containing protein [Acidobacteria bacterium]|jgi:protocatechuate 3,4-dioxygenase beta subunit|nr:carboxypeptidase regulatory-like domain-containing protein [Acidobacteriota bacterium]
MPRLCAAAIALVIPAVALLAQAPQPAAGTGVVAGRVLDAAGSAIADAVVFLRPATATPGPMRPSGPGQPVPVRTNAEGRFVFTGVPAGEYAVQTSKPGWLPGAHGKRSPTGEGSPLDLENGQLRNDLNITLWRPAVIGGAVTDDNGDPMIGVEVRAVRRIVLGGRRQSGDASRQRTDDRGVYRFPDLVPGEYLIAMLSNVVSEPPTFAGAIRAANDTPNAYYQTMTAIGTAPIVFSRATGVTGTSRPLVGSLSHLPGMPSDDGVWATYATTYHPNSLSESTATAVTVKSGETLETVDINVRLVPTFQISGVLNDLDGPAAWHAVHLVAADTGDKPLVDVSTAITDSAGAFTLFGVPPGQYIVRVVRTPYPTGAGARLGLAGGTGAIPTVMSYASGPSSGPPAVPEEPLMHVSEAITVGDRHVRGLALTMAAGPRIRGRVVFEGAAPPPTAEQLERMQVTFLAASGRQDNVIFPGRVSADGQFMTPSLWPGRYVIRASAPPGWHFKHATYQGGDVSDTAVDVNADLSNVVLTFTDRSSRLTGTVQAGSDVDVTRAMVVVFPTEPAAWVDYGRVSRRVTSTTVTTSGAFSMPAPPEGEYYIMAIDADEAHDWQHPDVLKSLAPQATRLKLTSEAPPTQSLRLRRIQ